MPTTASHSRKLSVVIVRDRLSAGGGIHNYYCAVAPHLPFKLRFVDVGQPHIFYGQISWSERVIGRSTLLRLLTEWLSLTIAIITFRPTVVHINPGMDASKKRALKRDAINLLIAKVFFRRTVVFWRGWDADWIGNPEFPGGNTGLLARIYRTADAHIVLSSEFRRDLRRWGFVCPIHLETTVGATELNGESQQRSLDPNAKNILFLSRIESRKGVFELYEAFCILRAKDPSYTLTYAGDGPDLETLRNHCADDPNVEFAGYITGDAKRQCYQRASVFCFLSTYGEGMPNAVLEALAMGLPIVSSAAGGLKDIIIDGRTGFVIPREFSRADGLNFDPQLAAERIAWLLRSPDQYSKMARENAAFAQSKFAPKVCAARLERIYRSVLAGNQDVCHDHSPPLQSVST